MEDEYSVFKSLHGPWGEWRKTFSPVPRKSIKGIWIIGPMYGRTRELFVQDYSSQKQFATTKEYFERKLNGDL